MVGKGTCVAGIIHARGFMHGRGVCMARGPCMAGVCVAGGMCGGRACMAGGMHAGGMRVGETAMETDGTYPTGMHSCPLHIFTPSTQG